MKLSEKIQEALREQQEINLSDPAVQKRLAAQWGYVPAGAQPAPSVPREAIDKMLTQLMDIAVSNGANSVSMPDEYVEVAAWLCGIPAQPAPSVPMDVIADYLVSISAHIAHQDDAKAQAEIGELLKMLASAPKPAPSVPDGWKLVPTAESRHPAIYKMLAALHIADNTAGLSEWDSYRAMLAAAPEVKP